MSVLTGMGGSEPPPDGRGDYDGQRDDRDDEERKGRFVPGIVSHVTGSHVWLAFITDYDGAGASFRASRNATFFSWQSRVGQTGRPFRIKKIGQKAEYSSKRRMAVYDCHLPLWATSKTSASASNTP